MERIHRNLINGEDISCVILADLHWGACDLQRFQLEIAKGFFGQLPENGVDAIFIAGDLFDMKEAFPSETVKHVLTFLVQLMEHCQDLFIIEGTRGHDSLQTKVLDLIFTFTPFKDHIHIYQSVTELDYCGMKLLLLPEEYVKDVDDYYDPYLGDNTGQYDLIIGHGMVDKIWYAKTGEEKLKLNHAVHTPVFSLETLLQHGTRIYFGHVHEHKTYQDRFTYVGPFTRWEFDKEWDPGFYYYHYNDTDRSWSDSFCPNKYAPILHTENLSIRQDYGPDVLSAKIGKLLDLVPQCDKLRIRVIFDQKLATISQMKDLILDMTKSYPNVTLVFKYLDEHEESSIEDTTITARDFKLYQTPEDVRIQEFIKEKRKLDVSLERICEVIGYKREEVK